MTGDLGRLAIALYVPDATVFQLSDQGALLRMLQSGVPELDFLPPPWWEQSHTARLGPVPTGMQAAGNPAPPPGTG